MPRFTIKDLLIATTLIAVGATMIWMIFNLTIARHDPVSRFYTLYTLWAGGGAFTGAGILTPFKRPWLGAGCGVAVIFAWLLVTAG